MRLRYMIKICLAFWKSEHCYAYKRYAYKRKNMYRFHAFRFDKPVMKGPSISQTPHKV